MKSDGMKDELEELFWETGKAHHKAFLAVNGEDDEWPRWYAELMRERFNNLLGTAYETKTLAELLIRAENERKAAGSGNWPKFYAEWFVQQTELRQSRGHQSSNRS